MQERTSHGCCDRGVRCFKHVCAAHLTGRIHRHASDRDAVARVLKRRLGIDGNDCRGGDTGKVLDGDFIAPSIGTALQAMRPDKSDQDGHRSRDDQKAERGSH
jgi:hypothetical protein